MTTVGHIVAAVALAAGAAGAATPLAAQDPVPQRFRFTVQGYLANYPAFDRGLGGDRSAIGGYGVRVMFNRSDAARVARSFVGRASAGAFATITAEQDGVSTQHIGGQIDAPLFAAPIAAGFLDPFLSLGAGVLRSSYEAPNVPTSTDFAVTPAAGTRIPFFSGIGFRGDLRAPIVFSDGDTRAHFLAEGGIYISF